MESLHKSVSKVRSHLPDIYFFHKRLRVMFVPAMSVLIIFNCYYVSF